MKKSSLLFLRSLRSLQLLALFACLLLPSALLAQQKQETFTPYHVSKLQTVLSAAISPDGQQVAYILWVPRDLAKEKDGTAWTQLHVVDVAGNSRPYVSGQTNVSGVQWTPDGKSISFIDKREGDKNRSLYVIPLAGGEARKVVEHGSNIQNYSWSHDGKRVAFLATEPRSKEEEKWRDKGFNQEIYEEDNLPVKVWIAGIDGEEKPRALDLKGSVWDVYWSPVDDRLAVSVTPRPLIDEQFMFRKIRVVDANTGKILQLLDIPGKMGDLAWSPDGKYLALVAGVDKHDPREGRLWIADSRGTQWYDVLPNYMGHVSALGWRDGNTVVYLGDENVWTAVGAINIAHQAVKPTIVAKKRQILVPHGQPILTGMSVSADGKAIAFVGDTPEHPGEVFFLGPNDKTPRRLTHHNAWLKNMRFGKQEVITHKARDGLELEGILVYPVDYQKGQRYPLVLGVHGGPEAHVSNGWVTSYANLGQVGAAKGIAVFYPNYRGSTGRGVKFTMLGQEDAAGKEFDDLVDAVDHLIKIGLTDKDKVGITGGSYGGYATAWGATYYSERFAAGVMFVGISNGISKVGTTDIPWEMYLVHHRKWLWDDWEYFKKSSPIAYVTKARTPLLIMHGKVDPRVHPAQSLELHRHLKLLGKTPVRLVFYPGEGHGNRRTASRLDYNLRLLRWMEHYLTGPGGSPPPMRIEYQLEMGETEKAAAK